MKQSLVKWLLIFCLCLALLGLPAVLGACGLGSGSAGEYNPAPVGTSSRNPYVILVSRGSCLSWNITLDGVGGKAWCASSMPTTHVGDYVQLLYGVLSQDFRITSVDTSHHFVSVGSM